MLFRSSNTDSVLQNVDQFRTNILDNLQQVNSSLTMMHTVINGSTLKQKITDFNAHLINLNAFYEKLNQQNIQKIAKESVKKARRAATKTSEITSML